MEVEGTQIPKLDIVMYQYYLRTSEIYIPQGGSYINALEHHPSTLKKKCKNIILERLLMKPLTNIH